MADGRLSPELIPLPAELYVRPGTAEMYAPLSVVDGSFFERGQEAMDEILAHASSPSVNTFRVPFSPVVAAPQVHRKDFSFAGPSPSLGALLRPQSAALPACTARFGNPRGAAKQLPLTPDFFNLSSPQRSRRRARRKLKPLRGTPTKNEAPPPPVPQRISKQSLLKVLEPLKGTPIATVPPTAEAPVDEVPAGGGGETGNSLIVSLPRVLADPDFGNPRSPTAGGFVGKLQPELHREGEYQLMAIPKLLSLGSM